jgi:hypothetical protein
MTVCADRCVRGPTWRTGRIFESGSIASHRKTHLCLVAQACAPFVQLQMWEPQMAEGALMQGLRMLACTSEQGS